METADRPYTDADIELVENAHGAVNRRRARQMLDALLDSGRWLRLDPDEPHLIEFRTDGWTIQHPVRCRPNLFACLVNRVGESLEGPSGPPPEGPGVYECWLDDGNLVIGGRPDAH